MEGRFRRGHDWVWRELGWVFAGGGWREGNADERERDVAKEIGRERWGGFFAGGSWKERDTGEREGEETAREIG